MFAANLIFGKIKNGGGQAIYARARTWLRNEMLEPRQEPLPPAASPERSVAALLLRMARAANAGDRATPPRLAATVTANGVGPALIKGDLGAALTSGEQSTGCRGGRRADRYLCRSFGPLSFYFVGVLTNA